MKKAFLFIMDNESKDEIIVLKRDLELKHKEIQFELLDEIDTCHGKRTGIAFDYTQQNFSLIVSNLEKRIKDLLGINLLERR